MTPTFCSQCGQSLKDHPLARFCPHCGQVLASTAKKAVRHGSDSDVLSHLQNGKFIQAVKLYREQTGVDLKTAKQEVEDLAREYQIQVPSSGRGCIIVAAILVALIGLLAALLIQTTGP